MKISAGILLLLNNKLLLCHPTNASWIGTYSPPKGLVDINEDLIDAAIRETYEEVGISIKREQIVDKFCVSYKKGRMVHKKVYLFKVNINSLSEIGLDSEVLPKEKIQLEEVDWAGFLTQEESEEKIFWRFKPIINDIFK